MAKLFQAHMVHIASNKVVSSETFNERAKYTDRSAVGPQCKKLHWGVLVAALFISKMSAQNGLQIKQDSALFSNKLIIATSVASRTCQWFYKVKILNLSDK